MLSDKILIKVVHTFCKAKVRKSAYKVLGVSETASQQQIKTKYYEQAQKYHPDRNPSDTEIFREISQAYSILKDPSKRQNLDQELKQGPLKTRTVYSSSFHYGYTAKSQQEKNMKRSKDYSRPHTANVGSYFQNSFSQSLKYDSKRSKQTKKEIKNALLLLSSVAMIIIVAEVILRVYSFNRGSRFSIQDNQMEYNKK